MQKSLGSNVIGFLSWDFHAPKGGMGRSLQWMADALRRAGGVVVIATTEKSSHTDAICALSRTLGGHLLFSLCLPFRLASWIKRRGIETLLLPVGPGGVFLLRAPRACRTIAVVYHTYLQQASSVPGQAWKRIFLPLERITLARADRILCFSPDTQQVLLERYRIPPDRLTLLTHGIDVDSWAVRRSQKEKGLCVCVARLEARKGVEVLLAAWKEVILRAPSARLLLIGRGGLASRIDSYIRTLGSSVMRRENVSPEVLRESVARAEIAVFPSYLEGFGLAAAEAMVAAAACIASDVDGLCSLMIDQETGVLVPPGDPQALADAIVDLLTDDVKRMQMAERGSAFARHRFDLKEAERALWEAVEGVARKKGEGERGET